MTSFPKTREGSGHLLATLFEHAGQIPEDPRSIADFWLVLGICDRYIRSSPIFLDSYTQDTHKRQQVDELTPRPSGIRSIKPLPLAPRTCTGGGPMLPSGQRIGT